MEENTVFILWGMNGEKGTSPKPKKRVIGVYSSYEKMMDRITKENAIPDKEKHMIISPIYPPWDYAIWIVDEELMFPTKELWQNYIQRKQTPQN